MATKNFTLSVNNQEIFEFYKNNHLDFESMNLLFVSILKKLIGNMDTSLNSTIANKLLENFSVLNSKIDHIGGSINKTQGELSSSINTRLNEYRKEYMDDIKLILTSTNVEQISPLIKESNSNLLTNTSNIIHELIPKNNEILSKDINANFKLLHSSIVKETGKLLTSSLDKNTIDHFFNNMNQTLGNSQQALTTIISSSETRIENKLLENEKKINEMRDIFLENNKSQQLLQGGVTDILKKFEKGVGKGNISENITYNILLSSYPNAQIENIGDSQKEMCDIVFKRTNGPTILIENKDHENRNVPKQDIEKFIRDCEIQDCCGIMLAQHRGISNKQNFEIQIHNGNVLLYVHEVNFDPEKIKMAIDIVEHFKIKLDQVSIKDDGCAIERETLDEINKEYNHFITQKTFLLKTLKDFNEKMNFSITEMKMPELERFLFSRFAFSSNQSTDSICKYCEKFIPKSMLQHYRYCSAKKDIDLKNGVIPEQTIPVVSTEPVAAKKERTRAK